MTALPAPVLSPLFTLTIELGGLVTLGNGPAGEARVATVAGGRIVGDGLSAILDYGRDDQLVRPDGTLLIDATYIFRTDDGACFRVFNRGMRHGAADVLAALAAGEAVADDAYFYATFLTFETVDPGLDWLNRVMAVARARRTGGSVRFDAWRIG